MKAYGGADSDESDTEVVEVDVDKLPPIDVGPDEHKLQYTYCLWYHRGLKIKNPSVSKLSFSNFSIGKYLNFCKIALNSTGL